MKVKLVLIFLIGIVLSGCALNQPIRYSTSSVVQKNDPKPFSISVLNFSDSRKEDSTSKILFENGREAKINGNKYCINSEEHYKNESPSIQVSKMIAKHLGAENAFKAVYYDKNDSAGYFLSGNLKTLYGQQAFSNSAAVGAQFGLIGALLTSGTKANAIYKITLTNIKVTTKEGRVVREFPNIDEQYTSTDKPDGYCWSVYWGLNEKLKLAVDSLVSEVYSGL